MGHHVALSVVGTERLPESGYFRAKIAQEKLIKDSAIPYSIVHATQFFEFVKSIADDATDGNEVRLAPVLIQPMAADDVASAVGRVAVGTPVNGTVEVAGPEQFRFDEFIRQGLSARNDPREVIADPHARYFGAELSERTLVPGDDARLGETRFEDWLSQSGTSSSDKVPLVTDMPTQVSAVQTTAAHDAAHRTCARRIQGDAGAASHSAPGCPTGSACPMMSQTLSSTSCGRASSWRAYPMGLCLASR